MAFDKTYLTLDEVFTTFTTNRAALYRSGSTMINGTSAQFDFTRIQAVGRTLSETEQRAAGMTANDSTLFTQANAENMPELWWNLSDGAKEYMTREFLKNALYGAQHAVDSHRFLGDKTSTLQELQFPRNPETAVPIDVLKAYYIEVETRYIADLLGEPGREWVTLKDVGVKTFGEYSNSAARRFEVEGEPSTIVNPGRATNTGGTAKGTTAEDGFDLSPMLSLAAYNLLSRFFERRQGNVKRVALGTRTGIKTAATGGSPQPVNVDLSNYYTKTQVDSLILSVGSGGSVDLSRYATTTQVTQGDASTLAAARTSAAQGDSTTLTAAAADATTKANAAQAAAAVDATTKDTAVLAAANAYTDANSGGGGGSTDLSDYSTTAQVKAFDAQVLADAKAYTDANAGSGGGGTGSGSGWFYLFENQVPTQSFRSSRVASQTPTARAIAGAAAAGDPYTQETITHNGASRFCATFQLKEAITAYTNIHIIAHDELTDYPSQFTYAASELAKETATNGTGYRIKTGDDTTQLVFFTDGDKKLYGYTDGGTNYVFTIAFDKIAGGSGGGGVGTISDGVAEISSFVAYQAPNLPVGTAITPQSFSTLLGIIGNTSAHNYLDYAVPTTVAAFVQNGNYSVETINHRNGNRTCLVITLKERLDSYSHVIFYVADQTIGFPSPNFFGAKELAGYLPNTSDGYSIQNMTTQTAQNHEGFVCFSDGDKKIYIYQTGSGSEYLGWVNLDRVAAVKGEDGVDGGPAPAEDYYDKTEVEAADAVVLAAAKAADVQLPTISSPGQEILLKAKNVSGNTIMLGATPNDITAELNSVDETANQNIKLDAKRIVRDGTVTEAHVDAAFTAKLAKIGTGSGTGGGSVDLSAYYTKVEADAKIAEAVEEIFETTPDWLQYFDRYYATPDGIDTDITNAGQPVPAGGATFANGVFTFTSQLGSSFRLPDELSAKMASAAVTVFGTIANQTGSDLHPILFESGTDGRPLLTQWKGGLDYLNLYGPGPQLRLSANGTFVNGSDIGVGAVLRDTTATGWINGVEQQTANVSWGWEADDQPTLGENNTANTNGNFVGTQKQMVFLTTNAAYDALSTSEKATAINEAAKWATTNDATKNLGGDGYDFDQIAINEAELDLPIASDLNITGNTLTLSRRGAADKMIQLPASVATPSTPPTNLVDEEAYDFLHFFDYYFIGQADTLTNAIQTNIPNTDLPDLRNGASYNTSGGFLNVDDGSGRSLIFMPTQVSDLTANKRFIIIGFDYEPRSANLPAGFNTQTGIHMAGVSETNTGLDSIIGMNYKKPRYPDHAELIFSRENNSAAAQVALTAGERSAAFREWNGVAVAIDGTTPFTDEMYSRSGHPTPQVFTGTANAANNSAKIGGGPIYLGTRTSATQSSAYIRNYAVMIPKENFFTLTEDAQTEMKNEVLTLLSTPSENKNFVRSRQELVLQTADSGWGDFGNLDNLAFTSTTLSDDLLLKIHDGDGFNKLDEMWLEVELDYRVSISGTTYNFPRLQTFFVNPKTLAATFSSVSASTFTKVYEAGTGNTRTTIYMSRTMTTSSGFLRIYYDNATLPGRTVNKIRRIITKRYD